jgi:hypothetical protein
MLTPNYLDSMSDEIVALYGEFETEVLKDIARRVAKAGNNITSSAEWQIMKAQESGILYDDIIRKVANLNSVSYVELSRIFTKAGIETLRFDNSVYGRAGLNPLPIKQSPAMLQILEAGIKKNTMALANITRTTAVAGQELFSKASDMAYMQIVSGAFTYKDAIENAVKSMLADGLTMVDYASGNRMNVLSAVRRSTLTGVNQTAGAMQLGRAKELDSDLVETTAHMGSRPEHAIWQGKVFSLGKSAKYPNFVASTGYGSVTGLCGANCRHNFFPFFEDLSEEAYNRQELKDLNEKQVSYTDANGKKTDMSYYEATQKQRGIEAGIRRWKLEAEVLESAGLDNTRALAKTKEWQTKAKEFSRQTGVRRDYFREKIFDVTKAPPRPKNPNPIPKMERKKPFETMDEFIKKNYDKLPDEIGIKGNSRLSTKDEYLAMLKDDKLLYKNSQGLIPFAEREKLQKIVNFRLKEMGKSRDTQLYDDMLKEEYIREARRNLSRNIKRKVRIEKLDQYQTITNYGKTVPQDLVAEKIENVYVPLVQKHSARRELNDMIRESRPEAGGVGGEDVVMRTIFEESLKADGRNALPQKVSIQEFNDMREAGEINIWRGFGSSTSRQDDFNTGKFYYGKGVYGNGTYTAGQYEDALSYSKIGHKNTHEYLLSSDARIVNQRDMKNYADKWISEMDTMEGNQILQEAFNNGGINHQANMNVAIDVFREEGRLASMLGFDAMYVDGQDYFVVLNRGKLFYTDKEDWDKALR